MSTTVPVQQLPPVSSLGDSDVFPVGQGPTALKKAPMSTLVDYLKGKFPAARDGVDGNTIRYGNAAPVSGLGKDGDFYIDTAAHVFYGPKVVGAWPAGTPMLGGPTPLDDTAPNTSTTVTRSAAKIAADIAAAVTGVLDFKGSLNASTNPNYPAGLKGDSYVVTAAGKMGGGAGVTVAVGDVFFATADNAGGTQAAVGANWTVLEHQLAGAMLSANNLAEVADPAAARANLGLGSAATHAAGDFAAVDDAIADNATGANLVVRSAQKVGALIAAALSTVSRVAIDRAALGSTAIAAIPVYLMEGKRKGWFTHYTAAEYAAAFGMTAAAAIAADTGQGVVVADGGGGAWVRQFSGPHNASWFGLAGGGADALPALNAIKTYFSALPASNYFDAYPGTYRPFPKLLIPMGSYGLSATFSVDNGTWDVEGEAQGNQNGGNAVVFTVAPGNDGFVFQNWNTTGVNTGKTSRAQTYGASGSKFRNIILRTTGAGGNATACGFYSRTRIQLINCGAQGFPDSGLKFAATAGGGGSAEGNANNSLVSGGDYSSNGNNGTCSIGADANNIAFIAVNVSNNGGVGHRDDTFLGSMYDLCHSATNGFVNSGPGYSPNALGAVCHYGGNHYVVMQGQTAAASTTVPGTNNAVWYLLGAGGVTFYYPTWTTGQTWKEGGAYFSTNANASTVFSKCYGEGDNAPAQLGRGKWDGGIPACGSIGAYIGGVDGTGNMFLGGAGLKSSHTTVDDGGTYGTTVAQLGGAAKNNDCLRFNHSVYTGGTDIILNFNYFYKDLILTGAGGGSICRITTNNTIANFGRAATVPDAFMFYKAFFGSDNAARQITCASAAPASAAGVGDYILNNGTATTKEIGWRCLTAGTPGIYETIYRRLYGTAVYDPPSLATAAQQSTTVTVTGAVVGDIVSGISFSNALSGTHMWGEVTAANTVTVYHRNDTGGTLDLASGTLRAEVVKQI